MKGVIVSMTMLPEGCSGLDVIGHKRSARRRRYLCVELYDRNFVYWGHLGTVSFSIETGLDVSSFCSMSEA